MNKNICSFFGHKKIDITNELKENLYTTLKTLIIKESVDTFLFGSKSEFDDLCYQIVSDLKTEFPYIKRIYVRSAFPHIDNDYLGYLLEHYEETYFPDHILKAGKASYVKRNYEMIDKSQFCIIYFNENYVPHSRKKSGTKIAYEYANKKKKEIINVFKK